MKTIEENNALFEEARLLRKQLKRNLHQNAYNIGYCILEINKVMSQKARIHLIEQLRIIRKKRIKK